MQRRLLKQAVQLARNKLSNHEQGSYAHFAFIVQNNTLIGYGVNQDGSPLVHWGYKRNKEDPTYTPKIHAEIHAFRKNKALIDKNKPFEIINIRLNKKGELRSSKPCTCCNELLTDLGCKRFFYSYNNGFLNS
jgi:tRNA(Arg) A34 adenosine deaminase TadA